MKKRMLSILLTAMIAIGILSTTAYATEVQQNYSIKVPLNAKAETVNGTLIYSDFTDTEGNYYDYYNPKDGSYFRWKGVPTDSGSVSPQVVAQKVRVYIIQLPGGKEAMIPVVGEFVKEVCIEEKRVRIHLIPGFIDEGAIKVE